MTQLLYGICFFLISSTLLSQTEKELKAFDSVFYHTAVHVSSANPPRAMYLADSLYTYASNDKQRLKSLMLKADILEKQEKRGEAIQLALEALELAKSENDYSFQARIYGFLSTQYRTIGFLDKGKESIEEGLASSSKIENNDQVIKYRGMANQELAEYALEEKEYYKALEYLRLALMAYEKEENEKFRYFLIGNTEEMFARAQMGLNNNDKALEHFAKANSEINKADAGNSLWAALIYQGYSHALLENKNLDSAHMYLKKALVIAEVGKHGSLKQKVYKTASDYYKQRNQMDSFSKYDTKFNTVLIENNEKKRAMVNSAYLILKGNPKTESNSKIYFIISFVFVLVGGVGIYYKKKKITPTLKNSNNNGNKVADLILPQKTEDEILQKLADFEVSNEFLDKNMSLSVLIGRLNTNNKYFRQILKKHKNKDYNDYINGLRINYIVNKLQTEPEYRNYKISYLAEESGFSSHSKFSADFKKVTQLSPSQFIESIRN